MIILTKIGKSQYIEDMYNNEYLFFRSLKDFRSEIIDKTGRLDPKELNVSNIQFKDLTIKLQDKEIRLKTLDEKSGGQLFEFLLDTKINVCSLYWLEINKPNIFPRINSKIFHFGDKALIIFNLQKFLQILDKSILDHGFEFSRKKVIYYDSKKINGEISLHHKERQFKYQNEFRILITPTDNNPIRIPLPGLKEISKIIETQELRKIHLEITN
jgi:hypothetical protein